MTAPASRHGAKPLDTKALRRLPVAGVLGFAAAAAGLGVLAYSAVTALTA